MRRKGNTAVSEPIVNRMRPLPEDRALLEDILGDVRDFLVTVDPSFDPDPRARMPQLPSRRWGAYFGTVAKVGGLSGEYPRIWEFARWPFSWPQAGDIEQAYNNFEAAKSRWLREHGMIEDGMSDLPLGLALIRIARDLGREIRVKLSTATPSRQEGTPFVPSTPQRRMLAALDGKALRLADWIKASGVERRNFMRAKKELIEIEAVKHLPRLGFYRPDRPPPEFQTG